MFIINIHSNGKNPFEILTFLHQVKNRTEDARFQIQVIYHKSNLWKSQQSPSTSVYSIAA